MAQQKSEDRVVPEGGVMPAERVGSSPGGQGKAVPVEETAVQLSLAVATAENPKGATRRRSRDRLGEIRAGAPKAINKTGMAAPATMEEVAKRLTDALLKVASNKGAPGPDGQTIEALADQWPDLLPRLQAELLDGTYRPGGIRRVFIPKAGGGQRGLGIPDVIDRVVQEACRQVLEPLFEPTFHPSSHGFRPGRSCHTAIAEAKQHLEDGYEWCVDLDLEKFFDLVCHQRLTARLAQRVGDRRLLGLIGRMLKTKVVLPDGVVIGSEQGVPQGGPLSPLLSNVVLDELDSELDRRGHRFARYADDLKVYVRSERGGTAGDGEPVCVHRTSLAAEGQRGQIGRRSSGGLPLPRILSA
jgi:RNA-directed DNA polymerase